MVLNIDLNHDQLTGLIARGAIVSVIGFVIGFALLFYILVAIASWKIFKKAGISGWKALIPIWNAYLLFKLSSSTKYFWYILLSAFIQGFLVALFEVNTIIVNIVEIVTSFAIIYFDYIFSMNLAKSFGKSTKFAIGLFFLPNIFQLILGFGKAEYKKID